MSSMEVVKVKEVAELVRNWLWLHRLKFVDLDEFRKLLEFHISRNTGLDCYYYVDEHPTQTYRKFYDDIKFVVEESMDAVRYGKHEVLVYVEMKRGVVELPNGKQFWLVVDFAVEPNEG